MKKISLLCAIGGLFCLTSCGDNTSDQHHENHEETVEAEGAIIESRRGKVDPVCNMVYAEGWEDYTAVSNDTVWFCSPVCKENFDANPGQFGY